MVTVLPTPPRPAGNLQQQVEELYRYLSQLIAQLNQEATHGK